MKKINQKFLVVVICLYAGVISMMATEPKHSDISLNGIEVVYINIAFEQYLNDFSSGIFSGDREIDFYKFSINYGEKGVCIEIKFNQEMLENRIGKKVKGGGGEFLLDLETKTILKKIYFK